MLLLLAPAAPSTGTDEKPAAAGDKAASIGEPAGAGAGSRGPILLFSADGLEWNVLLPLVQKGAMPTLAGLMRRGTFGKLASIEPTASPVIWTTIATGKRPQKHGITAFTYTERTAHGDEKRVFTSGHRKTKAFWNIFSDAGSTVDVVGWWITYPAEPIHGLMVSQTNTTAALKDRSPGAIIKGSLQKDVPGQVWPREREPEVLAVLADVDTRLADVVRTFFPAPPNPLGPLEQRFWDETQWAFRADETYLRVALDRLARPPAAVTAVYFGEPDVVAHRFWRYAYPEQFDHRPSPAQVENFGELLARAYQRTDRALGALLEKMPADTTVIVLSDHGMHADNVHGRFEPTDDRRAILSAHHPDAPPGVFVAAGPRIPSPGLAAERMAALRPADLRLVGSVMDVLPTLLVMLDVPVGADMDGTPIDAVLAPEVARARRTVPTHDTDAWLAERSRFRLQGGDGEERIEQLRALGYVR